MGTLFVARTEDFGARVIEAPTQNLGVFDVGYVVIRFQDHFPCDLHECGPMGPSPALEQLGADWRLEIVVWAGFDSQP